MNPFIAFLKLVRFPNLLIIAFTQYMVRYCLIYPLMKGTELTLGSYCLSLPVEGMSLLMNNLDFFLLSLSTVLIAAAGYIINDYFDVKIDRINKPDQMVIDRGIKRRVAMGAHIVLNSLAFLIGIVLSWKYDFVYPGTFIFGISIILLWFYSTNFKRMLLIGNLTVAFLTGMVPVLVALFELKLQLHTYSRCFVLAKTDLIPVFDKIFVFAGFAFLMTLLREIIKDIEDYEGDSELGCTTLAVTLGVNRSAKLVAMLSLIIMFFLGLIQMKHLEHTPGTSPDMKSFWYFTLALQLPLLLLVVRLFTAGEKKHFTFAGGLTKVVMLSGICYLFLYRHLVLEQVEFFKTLLEQ
ncbi:MAG: geranylgeranylglycerol-phosphate geranylgeranyltransferase [Bacteroidia bacterium]